MCEIHQQQSRIDVPSERFIKEQKQQNSKNNPDHQLSFPIIHKVDNIDI